MSNFADRLALHTWSLDTTPLSEALAAIKATGWSAAELRWVDFARLGERGTSNEQVLDLVRASGVKVGVIGTESPDLRNGGGARPVARIARAHVRERGCARLRDDHDCAGTERRSAGACGRQFSRRRRSGEAPRRAPRARIQLRAQGAQQVARCTRRDCRSRSSALRAAARCLSSRAQRRRRARIRGGAARADLYVPI